MTNREDRVAPRTASGKRLLAKFGPWPELERYVRRIEDEWVAMKAARDAAVVEAEAASLASDELRKAVEALVEGIDLSVSDVDDTWPLVDTFGEELLDRLSKVRALLSAGDKAETRTVRDIANWLVLERGLSGALDRAITHWETHNDNVGRTVLDVLQGLRLSAGDKAE